MITSFSKDLLQVRLFPDRRSLGVSAAADVANTMRTLLSQQQDVNMIFGAAPSQNEFLEALCAEKDIPWYRVNAFHMDEYLGLPAEAPQTFGNFLKERLFDKLPFHSVNYLNGMCPDPELECERYASLLTANPVDIVCLGIGENGHIAFNDPHVALFDDPKLVKIVDLDKACRQQQVNDGCFASLEDVPTHALTLTIPAMMHGKYLFCMVPAQRKAWAVYHTLHDPISEIIPATRLRQHEQATLYIDADSASMLNSPFEGGREM